MRVGNTRVMLDAIVAGFEQGHSPETIQQQFPALSLEEVYGAITYYLAHRDDVRVYLKRQEALWQTLRAEAEKQSSPVVTRLRALKAAEKSDAS
jgi:aspartate-semialdehyde dehydrogenase